MLVVLLNWLYVGFTIFCLGAAFSSLTGKLLHYEWKGFDSILLSGLILATVYAQVYSLFGGVGLTANIILAAVSILCLLSARREAVRILTGMWKGSRTGRRLAALLLILVWAYFTSRGIMHYDSDLYHAQSIRWIETYGVVKGLGNLHCRFGYNSSFFALSALYSMHFLGGQSLHTLNGFFALLLSFSALDLARTWKRRKLKLSDFARFAAVYYLTTIVDEVMAPASDYTIMCLIFIIVIKWLDLLEEDAGEKQSYVPYALLCVAGVYGMTLKLTAGLILLLTIKPAILLIRDKKWREIGLFLGMGLAVAAPWLVRTVLITGYLLYPFPALDLFSVDWKIHPQIIQVDADNIKTWGRALYNTALVDVPVQEWFPGWFETTLSGTEKLLILGNLVSVLLFAAAVIVAAVRRARAQLDVLLMLFMLMCSYIFWQLSAPLMRYGYSYVLLFVGLTVGWLITLLKKDRVVYFAILLYGVYKLWTTVSYAYAVSGAPYYVKQADYGVYEMQSYEINGISFYYPVSGDRTGYDPFPAGPNQANIEFRGEGIEDGFRYKY